MRPSDRVPNRSNAPRISPRALHDAIHPWIRSNGRLYQQLATALGDAIDRGDLPAGALLPPERELARHLSVSRGTIVRAVNDLAESGHLVRRHGSGTYIPVDPTTTDHTRDHTTSLRARQLTSRLPHAAPHPDLIDLGISVLPDAHPLPADAFHIDLPRLEKHSHHHGYDPLGVPALRRRIAELHTDHGLPTTPDQIAITNGAQHAIALTARLFLDPGDLVALETPTYPGAIDAYGRAGATFTTLAVDDAGTIPVNVDRTLSTRHPALIYLIPTGHNPTGSVMPDHRRQALGELADTHDTTIIEDESLAWLTLHDTPGPPRPIATWSRSGRVITIGSLSKIFWGGLRVGWMRGPAAVIARLGRIRAAQDLGTSPLPQLVALDLLDQLHHIAAHRRTTLTRQATHLEQLITTQLPTWKVQPPRAGLSTWVRLPRPLAEPLARLAPHHGVSILPGSAASPNDSHPDHLRIAHALPPAHLDRAIERLAHAWQRLTEEDDHKTGDLTS